MVLNRSAFLPCFVPACLLPVAQTQPISQRKQRFLSLILFWTQPPSYGVIFAYVLVNSLFTEGIDLKKFQSTYVMPFAYCRTRSQIFKSELKAEFKLHKHKFWHYDAAVAWLKSTLCPQYAQIPFFYISRFTRSLFIMHYNLYNFILKTYSYCTYPLKAVWESDHGITFTEECTRLDSMFNKGKV